jgi:hypothetical protein
MPDTVTVDAEIGRLTCERSTKLSISFALERELSILIELARRSAEALPLPYHLRDPKAPAAFQKSEELFRLPVTAGGYERPWQCRLEFLKLLQEIEGRLCSLRIES